MNKKQAEALNKKLIAAVNEVLKAEGFEAKTKMVWSTDDIKFTVQAATKEAKNNDLLEWVKVYGLNYQLGQEFKVAGKTLTLVEYKTRGQKYQWTARCAKDGKCYKLTTDQIKAALV